MTIKIKASVIWLDHRNFNYYSNRISRDEKSFRAVSESDWRKLMRLVKVVDEHDHADPSKVCGICEALAALEKKK